MLNLCSKKCIQFFPVSAIQKIFMSSGSRHEPIIGRYQICPKNIFYMTSTNQVRLKEKKKQKAKGGRHAHDFDYTEGVDALVHPSEGEAFKGLCNSSLPSLNIFSK